MRIRLRLSTLLWLVALVAVFLAAGIWLGECLEETRRPALRAFICESNPNPWAVEATRRAARQLAGQRQKAEAADVTPPGSQETPP